MFRWRNTRRLSCRIVPASQCAGIQFGRSHGRGVMLWIDYGFRASEFYHPSRHMGALMCHYRHYAHPDPFLYPGLQDITAHVDFSSVAPRRGGGGIGRCRIRRRLISLIAAGLADLLPRDAGTAVHMRMARWRFSV